MIDGLISYTVPVSVSKELWLDGAPMRAALNEVYDQLRYDLTQSFLDGVHGPRFGPPKPPPPPRRPAVHEYGVEAADVWTVSVAGGNNDDGSSSSTVLHVCRSLDRARVLAASEAEQRDAWNGAIEVEGWGLE